MTSNNNYISEIWQKITRRSVKEYFSCDPRHIPHEIWSKVMSYTSTLITSIFLSERWNTVEKVNNNLEFAKN